MDRRRGVPRRSQMEFVGRSVVIMMIVSVVVLSEPPVAHTAPDVCHIAVRSRPRPWSRASGLVAGGDADAYQVRGIQPEAVSPEAVVINTGRPLVPAAPRARPQG